MDDSGEVELNNVYIGIGKGIKCGTKERVKLKGASLSGKECHSVSECCVMSGLVCALIYYPRVIIYIVATLIS